MTLLDANKVFDLVRKACEMEVAAVKAGNVHLMASFADTNAADFFKSALLVENAWAAKPEASVGRWIYDGVKSVKQEIGKNTNLGIILLLAPLAKAALLCQGDHLPSSDVLGQLTSEDTKLVYAAIRLANPGGLNSSSEHDVNSDAPQCLVTAMKFAADYDDIARQYVTNFSDVYAMAQKITAYRQQGLQVMQSVSRIQIEWLADRKDTLIGRKCGADIAQLVQQKARDVVKSGQYDSPSYQAAWKEFDRYLRSDGNRLNPGTTADLLAAAIFVYLIQSDAQHGRN